MKRCVVGLLIVAVAATASAQESLSAVAPTRKRGWLSRLLHPFSPEGAPQYKDARLRGLALELQLTPQTVKLSEVRQLGVKVTLDFPTDQRIEIYLMDSTGKILTRWSENHAIVPKPGTILINPQERIEYNETIATRELMPNKVYSAEVFFPQYPELRIRQKFLAVP